MKRQTLDDLHGSTIVCQITIAMDRMGNCRVEGSITDREIALVMLNTAKDVVKNYHDRVSLLHGKPLVVPAYDTALVGTEAEKKLLAARHELSNAMVGT